MDQSFIFSSTVFLTLLLGIGLFFFVRASTKERIEVRQFVVDGNAEVMLPRIQGYFRDRAYQVISINSENQRVTLEGMVAASLFLAVLLTLLAIAGLGCLALVFVFLWPDTGPFWFLLVAIAPIAPWFYWRGAQRKEQIILEVDVDSASNATILKVTGHRDELLSLVKTLELEG